MRSSGLDRTPQSAMGRKASRGRSGSEAPCQEAAAKIRARGDGHVDQGIEVEMSGSGQIRPPGLLPTSYLDHCEKLSPEYLTGTEPVAFRRRVSEELEGGEMGLAHTHSVTFCPHRLPLLTR